MNLLHTSTYGWYHLIKEHLQEIPDCPWTFRKLPSFWTWLLFIIRTWHLFHCKVLSCCIFSCIFESFALCISTFISCFWSAPVFKFAIVDIPCLLLLTCFLTQGLDLWPWFLGFVCNKSHSEFTHIASSSYHMIHNPSAAGTGFSCSFGLFRDGRRGGFVSCNNFFFFYRRSLCTMNWNKRHTWIIQD